MNVTDDIDADLLDCHEYSDWGVNLLDDLSFYIEGVIQIPIAICGVVCNLATCLVLGSKEMRNSFNLLLIALAMFDSGYLVGSILESFRESFNLSTPLHTTLFPYLLYPGQAIMMSGSIFMTVAIALERYAAVHYPVDYNQAMNDSRASQIRFLRYLFPVILLSVCFNIPKFLESELKFDNITSEAVIDVTPLRKNPNYTIYYHNWARFVVLGIGPFTLLVYFNTKIYNDLQARRLLHFSSRSHSIAPRQPVLDPELSKISNQENPIRVNNGLSNFVKFFSQVEENRDQNRRRQEDNLALIFMGIVLIFLISHFPRVFLSLHEMLNVGRQLQCLDLGKEAFPLWSLALGYISHLLLVLNSSGNCLIYCILSTKFREEALKMSKRIRNRFVVIGMFFGERFKCLKNTSPEIEMPETIPLEEVKTHETKVLNT